MSNTWVTICWNKQPGWGVEFVFFADGTGADSSGGGATGAHALYKEWNQLHYNLWALPPGAH